MVLIRKFFAIIESFVISLIVMLVCFLMCIVFYISYKILIEEHIFIGVSCFVLALFILFICILFISNHIKYLKANFNKCTSCGSKIHKNTSLGGTKYIRFTCITCGEDKWVNL